jgi:hypothetical protein
MQDLLTARAPDGQVASLSNRIRLLGSRDAAAEGNSRMAISEDWRRGLLHTRPSMAAGTAIMFAVGAASGTVLSFELGLLWPRFIKWAGGLSACPSRWRALRFYRPYRPNKNPFYTE